ncbi:MAG: HAD family hydrolase [Chlorobiaceae bacterium]|nr:HAD family hydrolase [Chlorobiaceae bacterium]NMW22676.1 HAD family hydrolase [Chlorobiaceae bacterium]
MVQTIKVLFLDRDGTINQDTGSYIYTREQLLLIDRADEAIALAKSAGFRIVIVTNQAGIARGIATVEQVEEVNDYLNELLLLKNAGFDRCYYCPYHPEYPHPDYDRFIEFRKPATGMVERAIEDFLAEGLIVDRRASFFIGDKTLDVECGIRAGLRSVLVRTGHNEEELCMQRNIIPEFIADDLYKAVTEYILAG